MKPLTKPISGKLLDKCCFVTDTIVSLLVQDFNSKKRFKKKIYIYIYKNYWAPVEGIICFHYAEFH